MSRGTYIPSTADSPLGRYWRVYARYGATYALHYGISTINRRLLQSTQHDRRTSNTFSFNGHDMPYFSHSYNDTTNNERAIEIPIAWNYIRPRLSERILEVGNVLQHYLLFTHDILDKYESGHNVVNEDVISFVSHGQYDLIIAISTLEHIGWDEDHVDPSKAGQALNHLASLLTERGILLVTIPLGYNPHLDRIVLSRRPPFTRCYYLKRVSFANDWVQTSRNETLGALYNRPYPRANCLFVGLVDRAA
jgi:hypothetical protein